MSNDEELAVPGESSGAASVGEQFKDAEVEAKPYLGTDDSSDADSASHDAVAAGGEPDDHDTRRGVSDLNNDTGLPGVATATGMRRG
jgi:hypothetical protein